MVLTRHRSIRFCDKGPSWSNILFSKRSRLVSTDSEWLVSGEIDKE